MLKDLDYFMALNYRVEVIKGEDVGGYVLNCPELKGCVTTAQSVEEGFKLIEDAKRCWFTACLEDGIDIPLPVSCDIYSGQFKLRLPKSLHRELVEHSKQEGVSMNQYCLYLLSKNDEKKFRERKIV